MKNILEYKIRIKINRTVVLRDSGLQLPELKVLVVLLVRLIICLMASCTMSPGSTSVALDELVDIITYSITIYFMQYRLYMPHSTCSFTDLSFFHREVLLSPAVQALPLRFPQ